MKKNRVQQFLTRVHIVDKWKSEIGASWNEARVNGIEFLTFITVTMMSITSIHLIGHFPMGDSFMDHVSYGLSRAQDDRSAQHIHRWQVGDAHSILSDYITESLTGNHNR